MKRNDKPFEMVKSFGLGVLLKLTKTNVGGITIREQNGRFLSNVGRAELQMAVDKTIRDHHIRLRTK